MGYLMAHEHLQWLCNNRSAYTGSIFYCVPE